MTATAGSVSDAFDGTRAHSWAVALNETDEHGGIEITLLSLVTVGQFVRITGLVQPAERGGAHLASVPILSVTPRAHGAFSAVSAHLLPHGSMAWLAWVFARPDLLVDRYTGRIERLEFGPRNGLRPAVRLDGPWSFEFSIASGRQSP